MPQKYKKYCLCYTLKISWFLPTNPSLINSICLYMWKMWKVSVCKKNFWNLITRILIIFVWTFIPPDILENSSQIEILKIWQNCQINSWRIGIWSHQSVTRVTDSRKLSKIFNIFKFRIRVTQKDRIRIRNTDRRKSKMLHWSKFSRLLQLSCIHLPQCINKFIPLQCQNL